MHLFILQCTHYLNSYTNILIFNLFDLVINVKLFLILILERNFYIYENCLLIGGCCCNVSRKIEIDGINREYITSVVSQNVLFHDVFIKVSYYSNEGFKINIVSVAA